MKQEPCDFSRGRFSKYTVNNNTVIAEFRRDWVDTLVEYYTNNTHINYATLNDIRTSARLMSCVRIISRTTWFKEEEQMTNKEFLRRFDAHEKFTKGEIKEMCWGEVGEVLKENIVGSGRWTINKKLIFRVGNRLFGVWWTEGATEEQDGCEKYPDYPTEVRRVEKITYDYVPIEENK